MTNYYEYPQEHFIGTRFLSTNKQTDYIFISLLLGCIEHCTGIQRRWKRAAGSALLFRELLHELSSHMNMDKLILNYHQSCIIL